MKRTNRQHRLEQLRHREAEGALTKQEHAELLTIFAELYQINPICSARSLCLAMLT